MTEKIAGAYTRARLLLQLPIVGVDSASVKPSRCCIICATVHNLCIVPHPYPRPTPFLLRLKRGTAGLGLFTEQPIPRRRFIVEYWGKLVSDDTAAKLGGKYLFELGNGKTIFGTPRKNIARYINHSCKPNCEIEIVGNHVYVFSKRRIAAGEELGYDYGKEYFDYYIRPHGCRCVACKKKRQR